MMASTDDYLLTTKSLSEDSDDSLYNSYSQADPSDYLRRFKQRAVESIGQAYDITCVHQTSSSGALTSSLAEDVVFLVNTQLSVLQSFLQASQLWNTKTGLVLFEDAIIFILQCLNCTQKRLRPMFLTTLHGCCEAANDFFRMNENFDRLLQKVLSTTTNTSLSERISREWNDYVSLLCRDSEFAAKRSHIFIMQAVSRTTLPCDFFSVSWEVEWTHNEVALKLTDLVERYLVDIERSLGNELLYNKALVTACKATVCFYIRCLVEKADSVSRRRRNRDRFGQIGERQPFKYPKRALIRMLDDIIILKEYFVGKAKGNAALTRIVGNEVYILELIHEFLDSNDKDFLENFIVVIHKRTGADTLVTRHFVGDLFLLMDHHSQGQRQLQKTVSLIQQDLHMVSKGMKELTVDKKMELSLVNLDEMLRAMYEDRIAQGTLPLCWTCLPKTEAEDGHQEVVSAKIRAITRGLADLRMKRKSSPK